jgi:hypothetical protein
VTSTAGWSGLLGGAALLAALGFWLTARRRPVASPATARRVTSGLLRT